MFKIMHFKEMPYFSMYSILMELKIKTTVLHTKIGEVILQINSTE